MKYKGAQLFQNKADLISRLLSEPDVDLWKLRELALSEGGLVNDEIRRSAWPKLVGLHDRLFDDLKSEVPDTKAAIAAASPQPGRLAAAAAASRSDQLPPKPGANGTKKNNSKRASLGSGLKAIDKRTASFSSARSSSDLEEHSVASASSAISAISSRDRILAVCDDFDQIERDVARCTWHLLSGTQRSIQQQMEHKRHKKVARLIRRKQRRLANLINLTLQQSYPFLSAENKLRYFQGYHDVACVILATLGGMTPVSVSYSSLETMAASMGLDLPSAVLLQLSMSHFADCMKANFLQLQTALRLTMFPLLAFFDKEVHNHLYACEMEPFFALSWVITWFSHDIRDTELVKRLFDVFIVSHPLMPIYMTVAMIVHPINRQEVLKTECDFSLLHQTLQSLPRNSSMVGWKYRPGDGFVSDNEDSDDEDATVSSDEMPENLMEADLSFLKKEKEANIITNVEDGTLAPEAVSIETNLSSLLGHARVPFQELIDTSVQYMDRVPPHKLLSIAKRYYGIEHVEQLLQAADNNISLLDNPPDWAVAPTAKADWVLQQRAREHRRTSNGFVTRRERRNEKKRTRSRSRSQTRGQKLPDAATTLTDNLTSEYDEATIVQYLKDHRHTAAVIAAGYGRGEDAERKRRKRQRNMILIAVAVGVIAIAWGMRQRPRTSVGETADAHVMMDHLLSSSSSSSSSHPSIVTTDSPIGVVVKDDVVEVQLQQREHQPPPPPPPVSVVKEKVIQVDRDDVHDLDDSERIVIISNEQGSRPSIEQASIPSNEQESRPSNEQESIPTNEQESIPSNEQESIPSIEQESIPSNEQESISSDEQDSISSNEQESILSNEPESIPSNEQESLSEENGSPQEIMSSQEEIQATPVIDHHAIHQESPENDCLKVDRVTKKNNDKWGESTSNLSHGSKNKRGSWQVALAKVRENVIKPLVKNSVDFVKRANQELQTLPESRWSEFATSMQRGIAREATKRRTIQVTNAEVSTTSDAVTTPKIQFLHPSWRKFFLALRKGFPSLQDRLDELVKCVLFLMRMVWTKSRNMVNDVQRLMVEFEAGNRTLTEVALVVFDEVKRHSIKLGENIEHLRVTIIQPTLEEVPLRSIRMVRRMCKKGGDWRRLEAIPFFCER